MPERIKPPKKKPRGRFHHGDLAEALVAEAARRIEIDGHEALTLRELASSLGVSQPALYRHFASKDALLLEVGRRGLVAFQRAIDDALDAHPDDALEGLRAVARTYVRFAHAHRGWFRYVFTRGATDAPPSVPGAVPTQIPPRDRLHDAVGRLVGEGDPSRDDVYRSLWGLAHGLSFLVVERVFRLVETDEQRIAAADAAIDAFVSALRARYLAGNGTPPSRS